MTSIRGENVAKSKSGGSERFHRVDIEMIEISTWGFGLIDARVEAFRDELGGIDSCAVLNRLKLPSWRFHVRRGNGVRVKIPHAEITVKKDTKNINIIFWKCNNSTYETSVKNINYLDHSAWFFGFQLQLEMVVLRCATCGWRGIGNKTALLQKFSTPN